jgi:hypothetical protein
MTKRKWICLIINVLVASSCIAASEDWIPDVLVPWKNWVLFDEKKYDCPYVLNNEQQSYCAWPGVLQLYVTAQGANFTQTWQVFNESWVELPGDRQLWPQQVTVNGNSAVVLNENNIPRILLKTGVYQIAGKFNWQQEPSSIALSSLSRLVELRQDNQVIDFPTIDEAGRLWLHNTQNTQTASNQDNLTMRVFRQISDTVPMMVDTQIQLEVSGKAREITIGPALLANQIPAAIESAIPAKLDQTGLLTLQAQPGTWNIILRSHATQEINQIERPVLSSHSLWPQDELWAFRAAPELRTVKLQGIPPIDPTQTLLPKKWQNLPAFRVMPDQKLNLVLEQRGQANQQNQLTLHREAWLDFSGKGYTIVDNLSGIMQIDWRVEQLPPLKLGRVEIADEMQLLTQLLPSTGVGVEVRDRNLNLTAVSRQDDKIRSLPSNGWNVNLDTSDTQINLPPGWRILGIIGADNTEGTWWDSWTVWDAFIVFLISIAIGKLGGLNKGILSFITLVLMHDEPAAPYFVWLNIIFAISLLRFFTAGKMYKVAQFYKLSSFACLFLIAIPFALQQIQTALYPQTEVIRSAAVEPTMMVRNRAEIQPMMMAMPAKMAMPENKMPQKEKAIIPGIVQTGPAIPLWHWNVVRFSNAALTVEQSSIKLFYIEPMMNRILNMLRVVLLFLLGLRLWGLDFSAIRWQRASSMMILFVIGIFFIVMPPNVMASDIPSPGLLNTLKERLLKPALCTPNCATISDLNIAIDKEKLTLHLQIQVGANIAVPIPGDNTWLPQEIYLDGKPAVAIAPTQQQLLLAVTAGSHELIMTGALPNRDSVTIVTPLVPQHITVQNLENWQLTNVIANLLQGNGLQLIHTATTGKATAENEVSAEIPPYVQVRRNINFDKKITIETIVKRVAPERGVITMAIPLLPNERVIEEGFSISDNKVNATIPADQNEITWHSSLPDNMTDFTLQAPNSTQFTEVWQFSISPLWHLNTSGFPAVINHFQPTWLPTWFPWPGEKLKIQLAMPTAAPGSTLTVTSVKIHNEVGQRETQSTLNLRLRSSLGGQHTIIIPKDANVTEILANQLPMPINQMDQKVILSILPGEQVFQIRWRQPTINLTEMKTSWVDVGAPASNTLMSMTFPENRWVIATGGAQLGPSVMVWSLLIGMLILGYGLWRYTDIPLKLHDWVLLALGVSTALPISLLLLITWFAVMLRRPNWNTASSRKLMFINTCLVLFTVIVFATLISNLGYGLLAEPKMWIQSFDPSLINYVEAQYSPFVWYVDHTLSELKQGWVLSLPLWLYRAMMLAWSLWFAFAIVRWLRWGWERY